jgi:hypothetical protein
MQKIISKITKIIDALLMIKRDVMIKVKIATRSYTIASDTLVGISYPTGRQRLTMQAQFKKIGGDYHMIGKAIAI